jgi:hypothetical protein
MDEIRDFSTKWICEVFSVKPSSNVDNCRGRQRLRFHRAPRLTNTRFLVFFEELVASLFDHLLLDRRKSGLSVSNVLQKISKNRITIQCVQQYDMRHAVEDLRWFIARKSSIVDIAIGDQRSGRDLLVTSPIVLSPFYKSIQLICGTKTEYRAPQLA